MMVPMMLMTRTDLQWDARLDSFDRALRTQTLHKLLIDFPAAPRASDVVNMHCPSSIGKRAQRHGAR